MDMSNQHNNGIEEISSFVMEVNLTKSEVKVLKEFDKYSSLSQYEQSYDAMVAAIEQYIYSDDRDKFRNIFKRERQLDYFNNGRHHLETAVRWNFCVDKYYWIKIEVVRVDFASTDIKQITFIKCVELDNKKDISLNLNNVYDRYVTIVEQTDLVVFEMDLAGKDNYISENYLQVVGEKLDIDNLFDAMVQRIHPEDRYLVDNYMNKQELYDTTEMDLRVLVKNDKYIWIKVNMRRVHDEDGKVNKILGIIQNINKEFEALKEAERRSRYDLLTGALNFNEFTVKVDRILGKNVNKKYALMVFDIDNFRVINDICGADEGDSILKYIKYILDENVKEPNLYCRMYSDTFAIFVQYTEQSNLINLIDSIANKIGKYDRVGTDIRISTGIYIIEHEMASVNVMCDWASLAKRSAKNDIMSSISFYDETVRRNVLQDKEMENEMDDALVNREFVIHLQPKVNINSQRVCGAEALVRWIRPNKGMVPPMQFISLFEKNGFIMKLDRYVWEEAIKAIARWKELGLEPVPVSMNVSRVDLFNSSVVEDITKLAEKYNVERNLIELEITESTMFDDEENMIRFIEQFKEAGFKVSMDDFGAGFSSLSMLKDIPIDVIKIDKGFLNKDVSTAKGKVVIKHIIRMAKELELEVVAEGVETEEQVEFLKESGCAKVQGYYYARPLPLNLFEEYAYGIENK